MNLVRRGLFKKSPVSISIYRELLPHIPYPQLTIGGPIRMTTARPKESSFGNIGEKRFLEIFHVATLMKTLIFPRHRSPSSEPSFDSCISLLHTCFCPTSISQAGSSHSMMVSMVLLNAVPITSAETTWPLSLRVALNPSDFQE